MRAAGAIGTIYFWGQGVAIDYARAMAVYQVGAEAGDARCQCEVGIMYAHGQGVAVDCKQALAWIEKAAAQDYPAAIGALGGLYGDGIGVTPSWRRSRELLTRAIELGDAQAVENMQILTEDTHDVG